MSSAAMNDHVDDDRPSEQIAEMLKSIENLIRHLDLPDDPSDVDVAFIDPEYYLKMCYDAQLGQNFDFDNLLSKFAVICPDVNDEIEMQKTYACLGFSTKIVREVGPQAHRIRKFENDKMWDFRTVVGDKPMCLFIKSYKNCAPPKKQPEINDGQLVLTVKQAGLIGVYILSRFTPLLANDNYLMTPLAENVFAKCDIKKIAKALLNGSGEPTNEQISNLLIEINESCHPGGQYLPHSTGEVAVLSTIWGTKALNNESKKKRIIERTIIQYFYRKKPVDIARFKILSNYVHGGVPAHMDIDILLKVFEDARASRLQRIRGGPSVGIECTLEVPSSSEKVVHADDTQSENNA